MALTLAAQIEALLFAAGEPVSEARISTLLAVSKEDVSGALDALEIALSDRGLAIIRAWDTVELRTSAEAAPVVRALRESELAKDLGKASLETLALVLYKGGATRTEIDWVRGVNSTAAIRALLLRGLIERVDDPADKRRARYIATVEALAHLGATSPHTLPRFAELSAAIQEHQPTEHTDV